MNSRCDMKKKSLIIILIFVCIILFLSCGLSLFLINHNTISKNNNDDVQEQNNEKNPETVIDEKENVLKNEYSFELGDPFPTINYFVPDIPGILKIYFNEEEISQIAHIGEYKVIIAINEETYESKMIVTDTKVPALKLKSITIKKGISYTLNDFIDSIEEKSQYEISFTDPKMSSYTEKGTYNIEIKVVDESGNETIEKTTLVIESIKENNSEINNNSNTSTSNNKPNSSTNNSTNNAGNTTNNNNNTNNNVTDNNTSNNINTNTGNNNTSNNNTGSNNTDKEESQDSKVEEPEEVVMISYESKEDVTTETKYGTVINKIVKYYLATYSDGSTEKYGNNVSYTFDYSNFQTSTSSMLAEARSISSSSLSKQKDMLGYINQYRTEKGVANLTLDSNLSIAATIRAMELAYTNAKYGHSRPDGSSWFTVVTEVYGTTYSSGENYAAGTNYTEASAPSTALKNSPGHYSNMISENYQKVGIGVVSVPFGYKNYWVQLFAK